MLLGGNERDPSADFAERGAGRPPRRAGIAKPVGVETDAVADHAGVRAAVAERKRDRVRRLAGRDPDGKFKAFTSDLANDNIAVDQREISGESGADERGIVPDQMGKRPRQFL